MVGERGGKKQIIDEEPFDPNSIPMKRWTEYEQEMWESETQVTGATGATGNRSYGSAKFSRVSGAPGGVIVGSVVPGSVVAGSAIRGMTPMISVGPPGYYQAANSRPQSFVSPQVVPVQQVYPSDEQIVAQVKTMLASANLMTVTKKQVREDLALFFGVDMSQRKDFINKVIEDVLQGKL